MFLLKNSTRREIKFKVFIKDVGKLYSWILKSSFKKSFSNRGVNSLYYDTPNLDFANENIIGLSKRIKIRARWYSNNDKNFLIEFCKQKQVFKFEVKRKLNNQSDKIILSEFKSDNENLITERRNLLKKKLKLEISNYSDLSHIELNDIVFVGYNREYYENFYDPNIRLTIDKDIVCSKCNNLNDLKITKISNNYIIIELKFDQQKEDLIKNMMNTFPFRQVRSSKYLYALSKYHRFSY
jgi:hypothetical protein|tara:strand:+ start:2455 stop:3171 length:717 start_codon:yes stop_codon:yes gene_type:complete